jgi:hypothetical protein
VNLERSSHSLLYLHFYGEIVVKHWKVVVRTTECPSQDLVRATPKYKCTALSPHKPVQYKETIMKEAGLWVYN